MRLIFEKMMVAAALFCVGCKGNEPFKEDTRVVIEGIEVGHDAFRVLFYDTMSGEKVSEGYISLNNRTVSAPAGTYDILAYNISLETCRVEDDGNLGTATVRVSPAADQLTLSSILNRTAVSLKEPDSFEFSALKGVVIPEDDEFRLRMDCKTAAVSTLFRITGIRGMEYLSGATLWLTGTAGAVRLADFSPCGQTSQCFATGADCLIDREGDCLRATVRHFATVDDPMGVLMVCDGSGSLTVRTVPVTLDGSTVEIRLDLSIEAPEPSQDGLRPRIWDWSAELIEIHI